MSESEHFDREVMDRAIRRLNILEYVILGAAALLALLGGALVAWLASATLDVSFRISWLVASLLLFAVPGGIVLVREHLGSDDGADGDMTSTTGDVDG